MKKWRIPKRPSAQIIYVLVAFTVMIVICYFYVGDMERTRLAQSARDAIADTEENLTAGMRERETALDAVAESARVMVLRGESFETMQDYFTQLTAYAQNEGAEILPSVTGYYGAFEAFDYKLLSGSGWNPPNNYDAAQRPWYRAGVDAGGKVGYTDRYIDMAREEYAVSYARQLFDENGRPIGVVALSIDPVRVPSDVADYHLAEGGYGMMVNSEMNIIAHPHNGIVENNIRNPGSDLYELAPELELTGELAEKEFINYQGVTCIAFFERLDNGWYAGIITPKNAYYRSTRTLLWFLIGVGGALAIMLSALLLRLIALKARADDRARVMFDNLPLSTNLIDREYRIIDCNQETLDLFGVSKKEEYLPNFFRFSPDRQPNGLESKELADEYFKMAFDQGRLRFDWTHQTADGELVPCDVILIRTELDGIPLISGYARDLRELRVATEKLREADERTQLMLDATPLCCCLIDKDLRIVECNAEAVKLFELADKREFIDRFAELAPPIQPNGLDSQEEIRKNILLAFDRGYFRTEFLHQNLKGEPISTEITLVRVKSKDGYIIAGYIRDLRQMKAMVREMQRIEIAEESNKAKGKFVATMSHEMRTPLNAILGITEVQLMDETLPYNAQEAFNWIYNSGHTLLHIINDVLNLSKIEAGKMELTPVRYEMASLINDSVHLNLMQRGSKPIEFRLKVDENTPAVLRGDELRIKQILGNLLSNAFKYTEKGLVTLSVSAEAEENRADVIVVIRVTDTGIGMTREQTETVFDPYSRFTNEYTRSNEGTGLGMNITQNLVQMMGGTIFIESEPGKGTEVIIRLPQIRIGFDTLGRDTVRNLQEFRINPSAKLQKAQFTREYMPYGRVLIVDDVESNAYVARGLMAPYGLSVETVMSGFEAIDKVASGRVYDIIFMDHMMPKMDGIETTKRLRAAGYANPIVALTANAVAGQSEFFLGNGFDDFISKPINSHQLNRILNKLIRDKHPSEVIETARNQKKTIEKHLAGRNGCAEIDPELARIFARDAEKAAAALKEVCAKNGGYTDEDVKSYIVSIHAIKSALASIGQSALSSFALRLEETVRGLDTSVIATETPAFIDKLLGLAGELTAKNESAESVATSDDTALLREKLTVIAQACADYDKKPAKDALAELRKYAWTPETNELLDTIAEHLLHSSFEEAGIIAEDAIEGL